MQVAKELVGVEVLVRIENVAHKNPPGLGQLLAADLEKFAEFLDRRIRNRQRRQMVVLRFPDNCSSRDQFADLSRKSCRFPSVNREYPF